MPTLRKNRPTRWKSIKYIFCFFVALAVNLLLVTGCGAQRTAVVPTPAQEVTPASDGDQVILDLPPGLDVVPTLAEMAPARTPVSTATPDALTEEILQIVQETELSGKTLFWLGFADWINLGSSVLFVLVGYLVGTWLIRWLLPRLVERTQTKFDDQLLKLSGNEVRWLVVVLIFNFAIKRLNFIHVNIKIFIADISFFLALFLVAGLIWRMINLAAQQANERVSLIGHQKEADSLITLMTWALRLSVIIIVISLTLSHFGVNVTGFAFILGLIILVLSLAGRDILTDIISGAMILIDQPFRIGDRLELPSLDSWGDVVEIGMRSTKIISMENRMVILPNSQIGKDQIVNYSYPDPSYFNMVKVMVAYDSDPDQVADILVEAISAVDGVQVDREIYALLMELNEYHMVYWTCWWVANYADRYPVQDRAIRAMIKALKAAGIVLPYQKGSLNVNMKS